MFCIAFTNHKDRVFVLALSSSLAFGIGQRMHPHSRASHPDAHPKRTERGASHLLAKMQWVVKDLQGHAMHLLGAAEASESDAFLYYFAQHKLDMEKHEAHPWIQELGLFRQRNQLEDLFREKEGDRP